MNHLFLKKKYDVYEEALNLLIKIITEYPTSLNELITEGVVISLFESLETFVPANPKFIEKLIKIMCVVGYNPDGGKIIEKYNTVNRIIVALGHSCNSLLTNNVCVSLGEALMELISIDLNAADKAIDGCHSLIVSLKSITNVELFYKIVKNLGVLFEFTFTFTGEVVVGMLERGCFDDFLDLIRLPLLPIGLNNEFYGLFNCFFSIPTSLYCSILLKTFASLSQQFLKLEDIVGPFARISNFSHVLNKKEV